jgi:hypothetical protein
LEAVPVVAAAGALLLVEIFQLLAHMVSAVPAPEVHKLIMVETG